MALPAEARLVVLAGDGSWGYALTEIETAVRVGRSIVYVILNNSGLGWIKLIHGELTATSAYGDIDFPATARALGAGGVRVCQIDRPGAEPVGCATCFGPITPEGDFYQHHHAVGGLLHLHLAALPEVVKAFASPPRPPLTLPTARP